MPAPRVRRRRPGVSRTWRPAAAAGGSGWAGAAVTPRPAGRPRRGSTKRGRLAGTHLGTEVADQRLHRRGRQAEPGADVRLWPPLDEEGAAYLVAALEGLGGFEEEPPAGV